jgi:FkbM family methyltransferase
MKIYYGINNNLIDITNICIEKLTKNNIIIIPHGDINRSHYFTDPLYGVHKKIIIKNNGIITEYDEFIQIKINTLNNTIITIDQNDIHNKLINIQSKLKINYGTFNEELPEQKMVTRYLNGNEKVLEIGGNIGRNSLVIASILKNNNNMVTLESDINIAKQLIENRDLNNFNFHVECSALSNRKLIQLDWNTKPSDVLENGYTWVNTITLDEFKKKYNIKFDTLVLDCEGAFYYILMDMPEILNDVNLIIMENDYYEIDKKNYVDEILIKNNFIVDYSECGGWGPCYNNFFEVWKKSSFYTLEDLNSHLY